MPQFTLEYWKDKGWYVGRLLEVPGVNSQGETLEELEENIADAYREVIAAREALSRGGRRPARRKRVQLSV